MYYFLPLGGQKYFHKRPIGSFRGSIDLSLINSKMLRIKGCLLDGRILSIDGLWVKLLFMWIYIFNWPHVVEIAWLSTTRGLLKMKTHIKRSVTHKPSLILTKFDLLWPFTLSIFVFINERPIEPQNGPMGILWKYFWLPISNPILKSTTQKIVNL